MRYRGEAFELGQEWQVLDAILANNRLSVDWIESGDEAHLEATSDDGRTFRGTYGYPVLDPHCLIELILFKAANGRALLFGHWRRTDTGDTGRWILHLFVDQEPQEGPEP